MRSEDFGRKRATENRWHQSSECCRVTECYSHPQRHAEVAHRQAEGKTAETPQNAESVGPHETAGRRLAKNGYEIASHSKTCNPRHDNPTEEAANQPISFPGPTLHAPVGNVETAGSESAEPVKDNT